VEQDDHIRIPHTEHDEQASDALSNQNGRTPQESPSYAPTSSNQEWCPSGNNQPEGKSCAEQIPYVDDDRLRMARGSLFKLLLSEKPWGVKRRVTRELLQDANVMAITSWLSFRLKQLGIVSTLLWNDAMIP
jgi:hypothetical protein